VRPGPVFHYGRAVRDRTRAWNPRFESCPVRSIAAVLLDTYSGNVTTDGSGLATVQLPAWFDRINTDFRYQLTIVGTRGWNARVSREIKDNQFTIQTDQPNVQVSWQ
jgi:hypothetical protein